MDDLMDYREKKIDKFHQGIDKIKEETFSDFYQNNEKDTVTFDSYDFSVHPLKRK